MHFTCYSIKSAGNPKGLCRIDQIHKWVHKNNIYLTLCNVLLPFRAKSATSEILTPMIESRNFCSIGSVSAEHHYATSTLTDQKRTALAKVFFCL